MALEGSPATMQTLAAKIIRRTSVASAAVAAVLSPVPLADEIALVPIYANLARRIGRLHALPLRAVPWRSISVTTAKGLAARGVVNVGISFIPGVDAVVNAATAATLTGLLGRYMEEACAAPLEPPPPLPFRLLVSSIARDASTAKEGAGRMRLDLPGLLGDPKCAARVEHKLRALPGVSEVRANHRSGRVLVETTRPRGELRPDVERVLAEIRVDGAPHPPSLRRIVGSAARRTKEIAALGPKLLDLRPRWGRKPSAQGASPRQGDRGREPQPPGDGWHAKTKEEIIAHWNVDPGRGLDSDDAAHRLRAHGENLLPAMKRRTALDILSGEIFTVPTALLGGAFALSLATGDWLESAAIVFVMGSNIAIGCFTEAKAEDLLGAWGKLRVERATVLRDGAEANIDASKIVPGDVLILRAGDAVAADARILEAEDFTADESTLTGESEPTEKNPRGVDKGAEIADRSSMVYTGTTAATGRCKAVVCATAHATELGGLQRALSRTEHRAAPLERQLGELGRTLAWVSVGSSLAVTGLGLLRRQPARMLVRNAVALGVASIPEGFPAVGTTALALASQRLNKEGIVIRRLAAAETLGAVSVVCADKTGTLTENRMRIARVYLPRVGVGDVDFGNGHFSIRQGDHEWPADAVHDLARIAALNSDIEMSENGEITSASGTERALVEFALAAGYPVQSRRRTARRTGEKRRSADSPMMRTTHDHPELGHIELAKGAPEEVVQHCGLGSDEVEKIMAENESMASNGLRVLAFAWRRDMEKPLEFAGLVGLRDPARPHVREAIECLSRAGIRTMMLTGDQKRTALAIGEALGIAAEAVNSRVTPQAKLEIVQKLQHGGVIVAMTGDGVNDGPALKTADVGIAMGERGTDLARAVADVVLAHDDLPSLVLAVSEGRTLYDNVRRAIDYLVATNMSEVAVMLVGAIAGAAPLTPLQLLWINILTDIAPALALAVEPPETNVMTRPPRDPAAPLFGRSDSWRLGRRSAGMALAALAAYGAGTARGGAQDPRASTMAFTSLVVSQLLETQSHRARTSAKNRELDWVLVGSFLVQAATITNPLIRSLLGNAPLAGADLAIALGSALVASRKSGPSRPFLAPRDEIVRVAGQAA